MILLAWDRYHRYLVSFCFFFCFFLFTLLDIEDTNNKEVSSIIEDFHSKLEIAQAKLVAEKEKVSLYQGLYLYCHHFHLFKTFIIHIM